MLAGNTLVPIGGSSSLLLPAQANGNDSFTISLLHFDASDAQLGVVGAGLIDSAFGAPPARITAWTVAAGTPHTVVSYPFNQVMYFPANGYIQCPDAPDLNLKGDFTIDFWLCSAGSQTVGILSKAGTSFQFNINGANLVLYMSSNGSTWDLVNGAILANGMAVGQWYHFAVTRQGATIRTFINGSVVQTIAASSAPIYPAVGGLSVGGNSAGYNFNGWLDEMRISTTCRWSAAFTPSNQPYYDKLNTGGNDAATKLLLHLDSQGFLVDEAAGALAMHPVTNFGVGQTGSPYNSSLTLNIAQLFGATTRLSVGASVELNPMRANFTLDWWYHRPANNSGSLIAMRSVSTALATFAISDPGNGNIGLLMSAAGSAWDINVTCATGVALNTWYHMALVRDGIWMRFFLNGVQTWSQNVGPGTFWNNVTAMTIGNMSDQTGAGNGSFLDEIRYSDVARWSANFTPSAPGGPAYGPDPTVGSPLFIDTVGMGRWRVPADWNNANNSIEVIGAGAGGGIAAGSAYSGGGGGGGAYAKLVNATLVPGTVISFNVGAGGGGNTAGGDTWFKDPSILLAKGGGSPGGGGSGLGGAAASSVGTTKFNGGSGAAWTSGAAAGGGGGAGGKYGNGAAGGIANAGGGGGGGGGEAGSTSAGGNGANASGLVANTGAKSAYGQAGTALSGSSGGGGAGGGPGGGGGVGGNGLDLDGTHGSGGGGGAGGSVGPSSVGPGAGGGLYGAGGGGGAQYNAPTSPPGLGARGVIVIKYTP
jgi:hypothetical protein